MIYRDIILDSENRECQFRNMVMPLQQLRAARAEGEPFILISSDIVFDRMQDRVYYERDTPNATSQAGRLLIETEKYVLEYEKGRVYRAQDLISRVMPFLQPYLDSPERFSTIQDEYVHLLAEETVRLLVSMFHDREGVPKLLHFSGGFPFHLPFVCFSMRPNSTFTIGNTPEAFRCFGYKGYLMSSFFNIPRYISLYNHTMRLNRNKVAAMLNDLGATKEERR